jgi:hypothetical protein
VNVVKVNARVDQAKANQHANAEETSSAVERVSIAAIVTEPVLESLRLDVLDSRSAGNLLGNACQATPSPIREQYRERIGPFPTS